MQRSCRRCGGCCIEGGPALHGEDLQLIRDGVIRIEQLVTVRKGELVRFPFEDNPRPATSELVKLAGVKNSWRCTYYSEESGCRIYDRRPLACRILKCWDTGPLLAIVESDTLSRFDILPEDDPLLPWMEEHEAACSCQEIQDIVSGQLLEGRILEVLEKKLRDDLKIRSHLVRKYSLSLGDELFRFGRPLFRQLQQCGIEIIHTPVGPRIRC